MQQPSTQTKFTPHDYAFLLITGVLFYLLNRFTPFPIWDDVMYQYKPAIGGGEFDKILEPISSLRDVFTSQTHDYLYANGRFIVHCIVQCFCGLWGIESFRIASTLVFLFLFAGLLKLMRLKFDTRLTDKYLIAFSLFCLLPIPGGSVLWGTVAFSVNYLWTSCAIIWFLYLYFKLQRRAKNLPAIANIGLFLMALITGSLQESFSIGISGALFLYYCFHLKDLKGSVAWLIIGFWIGSCFVILAPANFIRAEHVSGNSFNLFGYLTRLAHVIPDLKVFFLLILVLSAYYLKSGKDCIHFIRQHSFWLSAMLITILFAGGIAYSGKRQMTSVELFSLILLLALAYAAWGKAISGHHRTISIASVLLIGMLYVPVYAARKEDHTQQMKVLQRLKSFKEKIFVAEEYQSHYMKKFDTYLFENYIASMYSWTDDLVFQQQLSIIASEGKNPYQLIVLPRTPEFIIKQCTPENRLQEGVYQTPLNDGFYMTIVRMPAEQDLEKTDLMAFAKPVSLRGKIKGKLFPSNALNEFAVNKDKFFIKDGFRYFVMTQPFPMEKVEVIDR